MMPKSFQRSLIKVIVMMCFLLSYTALGMDFYIQTEGDDGNSGDSGSPLATLEGARRVVRQWKTAHGMAEPVTVWLSEGDYFRTQCFELDQQDGGTQVHPVTWRACAGEPVRITGGRELPMSAFRPVSDPDVMGRLDPAAREHVLQVSLKDHGISDYGALPDHFQGVAFTSELFFGDRAMTPARWPNDGWATVKEIVDRGKTLLELPPKGLPSQFVYNGERPERWLSADSVYLYGYWQYDWSDEGRKVLAIDTEEKTITMVAGQPYGLGGGNSTPRRFYAFNLLEELDTPGEWYLDREKGMLYFWPPQAETGSKVMISVLDSPLITVNKAVHISFEGLTFEGVRRDAVQIKDSDDITLSGCTFRHIGGIGAVIDGGIRCGVRSNTIYSCGCGAISLTGGDRIRLSPCGHSAVNNHIYDYSRTKRTYSKAILLDGVGQIAAHNLIHNAPHVGILYLGNDHVIEYNEIHHIGLETSDAGVIYTGRDWTFRGNTVRYNYLHHNGVEYAPPVRDPDGVVEGFYEAEPVGVFGVYLDDCHSSTEIYGNVIHGNKFGVLIGGGRDNVVVNNIMIECEHAVALDARGIAWPDEIVDGLDLYGRLNAVPYQTPPWSTRYPELAVILKYAPMVPIGNIVSDNVFYRCDESIYRMGDWFDDFSHIGVYFETSDDPGFVNASQNNYQLREDSMVYSTLGNFKKIPFEKIGLQKH